MRLIVCCDGTWNTADQRTDGVPTPTNVLKFSNLVEKDADQLVYYHPGVGTETNLLKKAAGGMFGEGIDRNIKSAWQWIAEHYQPGAEIYLIGFSRGAYTARSVAAILGYSGLPPVARNAAGSVEIAEMWAAVDQGYEAFRARTTASAVWTQQPAGWIAPGVEIAFLGVWDTVGALGIPDDALLAPLVNRRWAFLNTHLGKHVKRARHALALDEKRASFTPTLWTDAAGPVYGVDGKNDEPIVQVWFPGVHSDVGGGYAETGLSDGALVWMVDHASTLGLRFRQAARARISPDHQGALHDSWKGAFRALKTRPRSIPPMKKGAPGRIHQSALDRMDDPPITDPPYHLARFLQPGESLEVTVYAAEWWNDCGIYLEPGEYSFTGKGEWLDSRGAATPAGIIHKTQPDLGNVVRWLADLGGKMEEGLQHLTRNEALEVWATRRQQNMPWFSLVGVLANNDGPRIMQDQPDDWSNREHEAFAIGDKLNGFEVKAGGYLYAYANDAWAFYGNNHGSVKLTVTRVS